MSSRLIPLSLLVVPLLLGADSTSIVAGDFSLVPLADSDIEFGCGCAAYCPVEKKYDGFMIARWGDEDRIQLRLNGKFLELPQVGSGWGFSDRLGEPYKQSFRSDSHQLDLNLVTTHVCPEGAEDCEVTWFEGTLTVTSEARHGRLKVWASCGC